MEPNPNVLGRRPTTPDPRDFTFRMLKESSPLELAFARLMAAKGANPAVKAWASAVMDVLAAPAPPPEPEPDPTSNVIWELPDPVLDQGDTPHCGGFGGCQWGNLSPVNDHYRDLDGHALYYESVAIGGYPGTEDGVESRWVAQALQARGRLATYGFASTVEEIIEWLRTEGPVMMGTDWTSEMFEPDETGLVTVDGPVMGGHFWVICGDLPTDREVVCLNSWGESYGSEGFFRLSYLDLSVLLAGIAYPGDAILSPEMTLPVLAA